MRTKYRARKVKTPDGTFDSKKEYCRYCQLSLLENAGEITNLRRQVSYELIPSQKGADGKTIERPCKYVADFVYLKDGVVHVEDVKGMRTTEYVIKRKLMLKVHGIRIEEV